MDPKKKVSVILQFVVPGREKKRFRAYNLAAVWGIVSFFGGFPHMPGVNTVLTI